MRVAAAVVAAVFAALVALSIIVNARDLPADELVRRCTSADPAWNGYQEDIKEIGARPVAQWHGEPVSLTVQGDGVELAMSLESPWKEWEAALPLLLKDPLGKVHRNSSTERRGELRVYHFPPIPDTAQSPPPWVEVQYPHTKRRIQLDGSGQWRASGETQESQ